MPNNKARLHELYRYLYENTDEQHQVTTRQILHDVMGDRKTYSRNTLPADIDELQEEGYDVVRVESSGNLFYLRSREFEIQELRLLMDAVAASRFITKSQSKILIKKLKGFASKYQAETLTRNLSCSEAKSTNKAAFYAVDKINDAINQSRLIQFQYVDYAPNKRKTPRHGGKVYTNSPYGLVWDNDHYYLVGWSDERECIVQFRVDRMTRIHVTDEPARDKGAFDMAEYVRENFQMYSGTPTEVQLRCRGDMMNAVVDRFGEKVRTRLVPQNYDDAKSDRPEDQYFIADVTVGDTPTFYAWVFQFGGAIKIQAPKSMVEKYQEMLKGQTEE